ncbi:MAG: hypothetical protein WCF92_03315 [bacterium]
MNPKIIFSLLILVAVISETIADIYFKKWSIENKNYLIVVGMLLYSIGTAIWAYSLRYELLSKSISIFSVLNLIFIILAGIIFFKETLSIVNTIGIILGVVSIIFLSI